VRDESSANGVAVDGKPITKPTVIDESSRIQISDFELRLEPEIQPESHRRPAVSPGAAEDSFDGEFDTRLEPRAGAAIALARAVVRGKLRLVGRGGPYDGAVFKIDTPLLVVGRAAESDIVLEDSSISRRHAQIRLSPDGESLTVLDLRSANGTFVRGERVKRADCAVGAVVRFGDLPFKLVLEEQQAKPGGPRRSTGRRRILVAAAAVVLLLGGVGLLAHLKRPPPPTTQVETPEQRLRALQAEGQRLIEEGRQRIQLRQWGAAISALEEARKKDPINAEIPRLQQQASEELENDRSYRKGLQFFELGNRDNLVKALEQFAKIPAASAYHREVRYRTRTIDEQLAKEYRVEGVSRCEKRDFEECQAALCKFFEMLPRQVAVANEGKLRAMLAAAEKRLRRKRGAPHCRAPRFLMGPDRVTTVADPALLLRQKYDLSQVRETLLLYLDGNVDAATKMLGKLRDAKAMRPHRAALDEINRQLLIIKGKYQEGYSAYRERDVVRAHRHWDVLLSADGQLLPAGMESYYRREVTRALGDLYFDLGDDQFKANRYRQAFELWSKGKRVDPRHERILNGMLQLEREAERLIRGGKTAAAGGAVADARAKLMLAQGICEEGRPTRAEAEKALAVLPK
jgi:tetratricopeptide (TPR) repeat protein